MNKLLLSTLLFAQINLISAQNAFIKTVGTPASDYASDLQRLPNGDFVVAMFTDFPSFSQDATIMRLDPQGNEIWRKSYLYDHYQYGKLPKIAVLQNGDMWVSAGTDMHRINAAGDIVQSYVPQGNNAQIYAQSLETDQNGSSFWQFGKTQTRLGLYRRDSVAANEQLYQCLCGFGTATYDIGGLAECGAAMPDGSFWVGGFLMEGAVNSQGIPQWSQSRGLIIKMNSDAQEVWQKTFDPKFTTKSLVVQTGTDKIFALMSSPDSLKLYLLNANGNTLWQRNLSRSEGLQILASPDGGVLIFGNQTQNGRNQVWLRKYDATGNLLFENEIKRAENISFGAADLLPNGQIALAISQIGLSNNQILLYLTDTLGQIAQGTVDVQIAQTLPCQEPRGLLTAQINDTSATAVYHYIWNTGETTATLPYYRAGIYTVLVSNEDGFSGADTLVAQDVFSIVPLKNTQIKEAEFERMNETIRSADGGFLMTGFSTSPLNAPDATPLSLNCALIKTNSTGDLLWKRAYGGDFGEIAQSLTELADGSIFMAGFSSSPDFGASAGFANDVCLLKTDASGNLLSKYFYGGTGDDLARRVLQTPNNQLLIAGETESNDWMSNQIGGGYDLFFLKTDLAGNVLWQKRHGGQFDETLYFLVAAPNGDFYAVSKTTEGGEDISVYKISGADGSIIWQKNIGGDNQDRPDFANVFPDGRLAIGFFTSSQDFPNLTLIGDRDAGLVLLAPDDGAILEVFNFGSKKEERFLTMMRDGVQGFYLLLNENPNNSGPTGEVWLIQTDNQFQEKRRARVPVNPWWNWPPYQLFPENDGSIWLATTVNVPNEDFFLQHLTDVFAQADLLPDDTLVCPNSDLVLTTLPNLPFSDFIWENGETLLPRIAEIGENDTIFSIQAKRNSDACLAADYQIFRTDKINFSVLKTLDAACYAPNGAAEISISGGLSANSVEWSDGKINKIRYDLPAGTHQFTVSDSICQWSGEVEILEDTTGAFRPNGYLEVAGYSMAGAQNAYFTLNDNVFLSDGSLISLMQGPFFPYINFITRTKHQQGQIWFKNGGTEIHYKQALVLPNDEILVAYISNINSDLVLQKINPTNGNTIEQKIIANGNQAFFIDMKIGADGSIFILCGKDEQGYTNVVLYKVAPNLTVIWSRTYGGSLNDNPRKLTVLPSGKIIILADSESNDGLPAVNLGDQALWILQIDPQTGDPIWSKTMGGTNKEIAKNMEISGNDFVVAAASFSYDGDLPAGNTGFWRKWIYKLSETGDLVWQYLEATNLDSQSIYGPYVPFSSALPNGSVFWGNSANTGFVLSSAGERVFEIPQTNRVFWNGEKSIYYADAGRHITYINMDPWAYTYGWLRMQRLTAPVLPPDFSLGADTTICHGQLVLLGSSAPEGFGYSWNWGGNDREFAAEYPYQYILTAQSAPGCASADTVLVDYCLETLLPTDTATCGDQIGLLTGLWGLAHEWSNGAGSVCPIVSQSGTYVVTITNLHGQSVVDSIAVNFYEVAISGQIDTANRSINLTVSGEAPFSFDWSNGATTQNLTNVPAGSYFVVVVDKNDCTKTAVFHLPQVISTDYFEKNATVSLFPNPNSGVFYVKISGEAVLANEFYLQNSLGQKWKIAPISRASNLENEVLGFDISGFGDGVYWLGFGGFVQVFEFVKSE